MSHTIIKRNNMPLATHNLPNKEMKKLNNGGIIWGCIVTAISQIVLIICVVLTPTYTVIVLTGATHPTVLTRGRRSR